MNPVISPQRLNTQPDHFILPADATTSPRRPTDNSVDKVATDMLQTPPLPERPKSPPPERLIKKYNKTSPRESASSKPANPFATLPNQAIPQEVEPNEIPAPINLSRLEQNFFSQSEGHDSIEVANLLIMELTRGKTFITQAATTPDPEVIAIQFKPRAPTSPAPSPPLSRHATSQQRPRVLSAPNPVQEPINQEPATAESPRKPRADSTPWQPAILSPATSPSQQRRATSTILMGQRSAPPSPQPSPPASPSTARKRENEPLTDLIFRPKATYIESHIRVMCGKQKEKKFEDVKKFLKRISPERAALFQAVYDDNYENVMKAVTTNRELVESCRDSSGRTIMHVAVKYNREGMIDLLIAKKFNPDIKADKGAMNRTPLHESVIAGHYRITCALLATQQCNPDAKDLKGLTPLHYAAMYGHDHLILPLCRAKATMNLNCTEPTCTEFDTNAFQISVNYTHVKVVEALLDQVKSKQQKDLLTKNTLAQTLYQVASRREINDFLNYNPPLNTKNILDEEGQLKDDYAPIIKVLALIRLLIEEIRRENDGLFDSALYIQRAKDEGNASAEQLFLLGALFNNPHHHMQAVTSRLKGLQIE